jgi:hypothetical protein
MDVITMSDSVETEATRMNILRAARNLGFEAYHDGGAYRIAIPFIVEVRLTYHQAISYIAGVMAVDVINALRPTLKIDDEELKEDGRE